jgi:co-chaperonin GroES (HSP10)
MKIIPLNNTVFLIDEKMEETDSGIIIAGDQSKHGAVMEVYAVDDNEWGIKEGDRVIVDKYVVTDVHIRSNTKQDIIKGLKKCPIDSLSGKIEE